MLCKILSFFLSFLKFVNGVSIQDLGGSWNVADVAGLYDFKATVPGGIYSDLIDNGIIGDVFYGYNDSTTRWVAKKNWTYSRQIIVDKKFYNNEVINLVFDGIDTFAEIYLNGVLVGTTENMFVQYVFKIKSKLKVGENNIRIKFLSPIEKATLLYDIQARLYAVPPLCVPSEYRGECHVNHIRKMQASFSWDWGPALPSVGIWKPVYLEAYHQSLIRHVTFNIERRNAFWTITSTIYMSKPHSSDAITGSIALTLLMDFKTIKRSYEVEIFPNKRNEYVISKSFMIHKSQVRLWWPNGYGNPHLYQINVTYQNNHGDLSTKTFNIGFRTVELVQDEISYGRQFYFKVNNVPIFAKGSNSIPISILPEKSYDPDTVKFLLKSAKDVHMNMIRVWGGGVYESDLFYKLADEMGILIWQDFMFACSMYPTNKEFISTVREEVQYQVRRLQYHPSIILWAGNNENEAAFRQNWYGTSVNYKLFKKDYVTLYVNTIREEVLSNDRTRPFLTSSPTNGIATEQDGYIGSNPQDEFYGDVHYYNYVSNPWSQGYFPTPRFSSEYGLQSWPSLSSWLTATDNVSDLTLKSQFMEHRQHHPHGNSEMYSLTLLQMELPEPDSPIFFKSFIFYTQIIQAMGMKQQTEFYRLWRNNTDKVGRGHTMGALYWQLNDVWVAPTWSGIDFNNNWKMLHYFAKNFFSPVIITSYLSFDKNLDVYVVSDLLTNLLNKSLTISVYNWKSFTPIHQEIIDVDVLSAHSEVVFSTKIDEYLSNYGCGVYDALYNCFIYFSLTNKNGNKKIAPDNFVFPSPLKISNIPSASVALFGIGQMDDEGKLFEITIGTDATALFVWLESGYVSGIFSDNGFLLITKTKTVTFTTESATTVTELNDVLIVTHLKDSQYF